MSIQIYYEYDPVMGVNCQWKESEKFQHDYFSSMYQFRAWVSLEVPMAQLIEITDLNYDSLLAQGKIDG